MDDSICNGCHRFYLPPFEFIVKNAAEIRTCIAGDEHALALIGQATFLETFAGVIRGRDIVAHCDNAHSVAVYRKWLAGPDYRLWLAEVDPGAAPVGYMVVSPPDLPLPDLADGDLELKRIYLLSKFQGSGIGKALLAEALTYARERSAPRLLLGVYGRNDSAIAFYQRCGFRKIGDRRFNVGGREYDDYIMALDL